MYQNEQRLWNRGLEYIVGVDEVGRGPLAGPVVAAAVILNSKERIKGLKDSKQLSQKKRAALLEEIKEKAIAYAYAFVDESTIDSINIYQASKKAMMDAIAKLDKKVDYILSDAMPLGDLKIPYEAIIKGDTLSASIAAASIVAKEVRDAFMCDMDHLYPGYGFAKHKGYPTKQHLQALKENGICPIHRKTYKPVKEIIEKQISFWE